MRAQVLKKDGKPEFAVLPITEYRDLIKRLEDLEDVRDVREYRANPGESFPAAVVNQLIDGIPPVKVFREYRGMTLEALGTICGVSAAALSQIENGKREPSVGLLKKLSAALRVDVDILIG
jgi:DNA-binding XRE family transcriptional regulator